MNYEVLEALRQIAQEKNVNRDLVLETLEIGLISAAKKRFNTGDNVEVNVDTESGSMPCAMLLPAHHGRRPSARNWTS